MNMISTGAFLNEMDASNKQPTVAEKFAAVWEKKNAKAAQAGGVSLMALSLAACGSSSTTTSTTTTTTDTTTTTTTTPAAQTLELTTRSDDLTGGAGDDLFDGRTAGEFTDTDHIDGGAGSDTLDVTIDNAQITASSIKNVEKVMVQSTHDNADILFDNADTSVTNVTVTTSAKDVDLLNLQNNLTVSMIDVTSGASGVTIDFDDDHVGSKTATLSLELDGSTVAVDVVTGGDDAFTTLSINSLGSGTASASALTIDIDTYTTLNFSGSSDVELISTDKFSALTKIDGKTATGGLTIDLDDNAKAYTIELGAGDDTIVADQANTGTGGRTIDMGAGKDTLDLAALGAETDDVFKGGDGVDTLKSSDTSTIETKNNGISGFERIALTEATTFDMSKYADNANVTTIRADSTTDGTAFAVTNAPSSVTTLELDADTAGDANQDDDEDVSFARAVDGTADSINVIATATARLGDELILDGEETISMDSNTATITLSQGLSANSATSLTIVGDNAVDLSAVDAAKLTTLDASGMTKTAALTVSSMTTTKDLTVTGGSTDYTGVVTITTGTGNDTVTTTGGDDVINTGNGNDTISSGKGADDITPGRGNDTITTGDGADEIFLAVGVNGATAALNGVATITDFKAGASGDELVIDVEANVTSSDAETIEATSTQITSQSTVVVKDIVVYTGNNVIDTSGDNAADMVAINNALFDPDAIDAGIDTVAVFSADTNGDGTGDEVQVWAVGANDGATDGNADFAYHIATLSNIDATADLAGVFHADNFDIV